MSTAVAPAGIGVRDLSALFDPRSVGVIGVSDDPAKWGHHLAVQLLRAPVSDLPLERTLTAVRNDPRLAPLLAATYRALPPEVAAIAREQPY